MNKPIIAIFVAGNLSTPEELQIINKYLGYPHIILNAETFDPNTALVVDGVIGKVPQKLQNLPDPDTVITKWKESVGLVERQVGGTPPQTDPKQNGFNN